MIEKSKLQNMKKNNDPPLDNSIKKPYLPFWVYAEPEIKRVWRRRGLGESINIKREICKVSLYI